MIIRNSFETKPFYDIAKELLVEVEQRQREGGVTLIGKQTTFEDLDETIGGWRDDEMYIIGGATGSGKSSFLLGELLGTARRGAVSVYLSLEMSAKLLALRSLSSLTGLPAMNIERGMLTDETLKYVMNAAETFNKLPIYFYDQNVTTDEWRGILELHKSKFGLDIAAVDYIALFSDRGDSPYARMTTIADILRGHAKTFDIPYLVASQLNRASLSQRPTLAALKESGQIENNAGCVLFPWQDPDVENIDPNVRAAEIIVAKNRHGPTYTIDAQFHAKQMLWKPRGYEIINPPSARRN